MQKIIKPIIYIKYGELALKGKNRKDFVHCLARNIKKALKQYSYLDFYVSYDYLKITNLENNDLNLICEELQDVFGIASFSVAYECQRDIDAIVETSKMFIDANIKGLTFKLEAKRSDKTYEYDSTKIKQLVATKLLNKFNNLVVNVKKPQLTINIEVKKDCVIVFGNKIEGAKGLPVGINGKALVLLSGGIDSPVAARLIMKRGIAVDFITFITPPHTSQKALDKVIGLSKIITKNNKLCNSNLYVCNFTKLQDEIAHISNESYRITIMRRYFLRIAKQLAIQNNIKTLVTGESLGQVASQTLDSMQTIASVLDDFLVLRPLITYDKQEIIELAIKYKTYDLSILPYDDSCSLFAPKNPTTSPKIKIAQQLESESMIIDDIAQLVYREIIKV